MCQQCIIYVVDRVGAFDIIENGERPSNVAGISIRTGIKNYFQTGKKASILRFWIFQLESKYIPFVLLELFKFCLPLIMVLLTFFLNIIAAQNYS